MPRYFFNCEGALHFLDEEGTDLADAKAAQTECIRQAGEILRDHARDFSPPAEWRVTVTDEAGAQVLFLNFALGKP